MHLIKSNYIHETPNIINLIPNKLNNLIGIEATEENKSFLSIISHNIKNPFGALLGYSDLLMEDYSELSEDEKLSYINDINKTAKLTYRYLERFLEWTYYKTNKIKLEFEQLNVRELIAESTKLAFVEDNYLGEINFNISADIKIFSDYETIKKAFYYIIENSLKYTKGDGIITINARSAEQLIEVEVIDNGIGISYEKINKLFDITENINQNNKGFKNGSGLGLILAKQIIALNNGNIFVESELNSGTKVVIKLPKR